LIDDDPPESRFRLRRSYLFNQSSSQSDKEPAEFPDENAYFHPANMKSGW
jgi:hypothetical protein